MKDLQSYISNPVNEAYNPSYDISFMMGGKEWNATLKLENPKDSVLMDKWFEEQVDNTIRFVSGGPNDIDLPE